MWPRARRRRSRHPDAFGGLNESRFTASGTDWTFEAWFGHHVSVETSSDRPGENPEEDRPAWTFFTNHAHVLICLAREPDLRLSQLADRVGIGERAVHRIVHDLVEAGYLELDKVGRRNHYRVDLDRPLRHRLESHQLLRAIVEPLLDLGHTRPSPRSLNR